MYNSLPLPESDVCQSEQSVELLQLLYSHMCLLSKSRLLRLVKWRMLDQIEQMLDHLFDKNATIPYVETGTVFLDPCHVLWGSKCQIKSNITELLVGNFLFLLGQIEITLLQHVSGDNSYNMPLLEKCFAF